eukprot:SAG11_NODE_14910_length_595_cov_1.213710_1_plen_101_part_10
MAVFDLRLRSSVHRNSIGLRQELSQILRTPMRGFNKKKEDPHELHRWTPGSARGGKKGADAPSWGEGARARSLALLPCNFAAHLVCAALQPHPSVRLCVWV